MKKWMVWGMLAVMTASVSAIDFYGIPMFDKPSDDISAILQNLIKGDREKAEQHLKHLASTAPLLARTIKLADLEIPCADCAVEKEADCEACSGKLSLIDPHALRYLQYKFDTALENFDPVETAWADSRKAFEVRRKQVPAREVFQGNIIRIGQDAFLIKSVDDEIFYLMGCTTTGAQVGQPLVGYCWPMPKHPHTYKGKGGTSTTVKSYTLNLWWDY
jgi:hypothetical protein